MDPSLVIERLDQVLDVSDLLVVLDGSSLPSVKLTIELLSDIKDSLDLRLDNRSPHVFVELGNLLSLLEGDTSWVVSLIVNQLSQLSLWEVILFWDILWNG